MNRKVLFGLLAAAAVAVLIFFARPVNDGMVPPVEVKPVSDGKMTKEERVAYLNQFAKLEGLALVPDTEPNSEKVVPGLLRVTGTLTNGGDKTLEEAHLMVLPKNAEDKVLSSYVENVLGNGPLKPGESRKFLFRLPAKPEYTGTFDHKWR